VHNIIELSLDGIIKYFGRQGYDRELNDDDQREAGRAGKSTVNRKRS
jgi:hypothetical protein